MEKNKLTPQAPTCKMDKKKSVKRKADDGDDVEIVDESGGGGGGGGKKAKKAEKAPPKPKAPPKLKPFTAEDEEIAKGASMERNKAMATYLEGIWSALKAEVGIFCPCTLKVFP